MPDSVTLTAHKNDSDGGSELDSLYNFLGLAIIERRKNMGLTQDELAQRSGVDRAFLSELERGKRRPSFGTVSKLARGLNMPFARLVKRCEVLALSYPTTPEAQS